MHTVFQDYALFPHLSVPRNVDYPLRIAGVDRAPRAGPRSTGYGAAGRDGRARPDRRPGFTRRWWQAAATNDGVRAAVVTSLQVALAATEIAVVLGTLASMALVRHSFFGRDAVSLLVLLPIALPGIVTGIALNTLFTQAWAG